MFTHMVYEDDDGIVFFEGKPEFNEGTAYWECNGHEGYRFATRDALGKNFVYLEGLPPTVPIKLVPDYGTDTPAPDYKAAIEEIVAGLEYHAPRSGADFIEHVHVVLTKYRCPEPRDPDDEEEETEDERIEREERDLCHAPDCDGFCDNYPDTGNACLHGED